MIELFIILVLAALGWLVWKGKLDLKSLLNLAKQVTGSTGAATDDASSQHQQPKAPATPAPQTAEPTVATAIETPAPTVEPIAPPTTSAAPTPVATEALVAPAIKAAPVASMLPEDSILKRHCLTALQAEKDARSNPYPTDSVLRRHYDALHKIDAPKAAEVVAASIPDSVAIEASGNETKTDLPYTPTDSVLKRHHEQLIRSAM